MTTGEAACLYPSRVMHQRRVAPLYRFVYRVFYLLLDIDRVDEAARGVRLFSHNRWNLLSFHDSDHGDGRGGAGALRAWAQDILAAEAIDLEGGRIRILALPRLCGLVFNPVAFWFCEHSDGSLRAVIAEVNNTFGEKHCYLLDRNGAAIAAPAAFDKDKAFHVSPFFDVAGRYRFRLQAPAARLHITIHYSHDGAVQFDAALWGNHARCNDAQILRLVLAVPAMTLKVVAAIHWEALKLWLRGARFHRKPAAPQPGVS
jgi:DUF1365 family protein